jgi:hypothetical protein
MKICNTCKEEKDETAFYFSGNYIYHHCKKCNSEKSKQWYQINKDIKKESSLKWHYKSKYGLTFEQRQALFDKQEGKCAVCNCDVHLDGTKNATQAVIDHCHTSGKVRGVLCNTCNQGLGFFKDDVTVIQNAIKYLKENTN